MASAHCPDRLAEPALLPCPFCQGAPPPRGRLPVLLPCPSRYGGGWHVTCTDCRIQTRQGLTREEAIAAWQDRPDLAQFSARLEPLHSDQAPPREALLPCPFCQGAPRPRPWGPVVIATPVLEAIALDSGGGWRVTCYGCRVQTWNGLTRDEAMAAWNYRTPLAEKG